MLKESSGNRLFKNMDGYLKPKSSRSQIEWCVLFDLQMYDLRVTINDGFLNSEKTFGQFELIHKQLQKYFIESKLPQ